MYYQGSMLETCQINSELSHGHQRLYDHVYCIFVRRANTGSEYIHTYMYIHRGLCTQNLAQLESEARWPDVR